jgi:hypothetical protein
VYDIALPFCLIVFRLIRRYFVFSGTREMVESVLLTAVSGRHAFRVIAAAGNRLAIRGGGTPASITQSA